MSHTHTHTHTHACTHTHTQMQLPILLPLQTGHTHLAEPGCLCIKQALWPCKQSSWSQARTRRRINLSSQQVVWTPPKSHLDHCCFMRKGLEFASQQSQVPNHSWGGLVGLVWGRRRKTRWKVARVGLNLGPQALSQGTTTISHSQPHTHTHTHNHTQPHTHTNTNTHKYSYTWVTFSYFVVIVFCFFCCFNFCFCFICLFFVVFNFVSYFRFWKTTQNLTN